MAINEIKSMRVDTGLTQRQASAVLGVPLSTLRKWEQGVAVPPSYVAEMVERELARIARKKGETDDEKN